MSSRERKPHLFLLCVDSLRADSLDRHGGDSIWKEIGPPSTPALDRIAGSSIRFLSAVASSSWTKPSLPSMFLSLHPSEHGILETAKSEEGTISSPPMPSDITPLADALTGGGYQTIGLTHNAQLDSIRGFDRGFDCFSGSAGDGDSILGLLRKLDPFASGAPVFAYIHYLEPHWPYGERVVRRMEDHAAGRFPFHRFTGAEWKAFKKELKKGHTMLTPGEVRFLRIAYRAAVEEADRVVGNLVDWLGESGVLEKSLVILTADHGEELFDHGSVGHGQSLHEELVHVPLHLRLPEGLAIEGVGENGVSSEFTDPVSHVDLLPTLLGAAGLPPAEHAAGRNLLETAGQGENGRFVFSEVKHKRRYKQSIRGSRFKMIRTYVFDKDHAKRSERGGRDDYNNLDDLVGDRPHRIERQLFDIEEDPRETRDLSTVRIDLLVDLEEKLEAWWRGLRRFGSERAYDVDTEVIHRLEALGYM